MNKPPKSLKDILIGLSLDLSDNLIQIQKLERELTDRRSTQVVLLGITPLSPKEQQ